MKKMSNLNMAHGKCLIISFPLLRFTLVIKLRNFNSESHQNTFIFYEKKNMTSDWNMSHAKMSDLAYFHCLGSL